MNLPIYLISYILPKNNCFCKNDSYFFASLEKNYLLQNLQERDMMKLRHNLIFPDKGMCFLLVKTHARTSCTFTGMEDCVAAMESCVFRVHGFGCAPFLFLEAARWTSTM